MEALVDIRISEDGPTGDPDGIDLRPKSIVDLARVAPELIIMHKPAHTQTQTQTVQYRKDKHS